MWNINKSLKIIDDAVEKHGGHSLIGMMSGGHDSIVACHIASKHEKFDFIAHINTGIGIESTRQHARDTAKSWGLDFKEYLAEDQGQIYEELVLERGFPGAYYHRFMYTKLKERAIRQMCRDYGRSKNKMPIIVTGARKEESTRRMGTTKEIQKRGNEIWINPISEMTSEQKWNYIELHKLPKNEIALKLCMSGECLCGAFAHPGELAEIKEAAPEAYEEIKELEKKVRAAGFPWGWEEQPPKWWLEKQKGQEMLFDMGSDDFRPLCTSCEARLPEAYK